MKTRFYSPENSHKSRHGKKSFRAEKCDMLKVFATDSTVNSLWNNSRVNDTVLGRGMDYDDGYIEEEIESILNVVVEKIA